MNLPVFFFSRPTLEVAEDLIGKVLVRKSEEGITSGIIVEAEASLSERERFHFTGLGVKIKFDE